LPINCKTQVQLIVDGNKTKPTEKDDDKMEFTNETTKAAVRDYIKQVVDKMLIYKIHLEKLTQEH